MPAYSWFLALGSISFWFTVLVRRKRNRLLLLFFHLIPYGHGLVSQGREPFSSWRYPFQLLAHQLGKNQKTNLKMCWKIYWDYHVWTLLPGLRFIYCLIITSDLCLEHFSSKKKIKKDFSELPLHFVLRTDALVTARELDHFKCSPRYLLGKPP